MDMTDFMAGEWAYLKVQEKDKPTRLTKKMLNDGIDAKPIPLDRTTLIRNDFGIVKRDDEDYSDGFTYRLKNDSGIYATVNEMFKRDGTQSDIWRLRIVCNNGSVDLNIRYVHELQRQLGLCGIQRYIKVFDDGIVFAPYIMADSVGTVGDIGEMAKKEVNSRYATVEVAPNTYGTMPKYKVGDIFTKKGCRDCAVMKVTQIILGLEPIYHLEPVKGIGLPAEWCESALDELYRYVERKN